MLSVLFWNAWHLTNTNYRSGGQFPGEKEVKTIHDQYHQPNINEAVRGQVRFVPFPHRDLYHGNAAHCEWKSLPATHGSDPVVSSMIIGVQQESTSSELRKQHPFHLDPMQSGALRQTICAPTNQTLLKKIHLFSTEQAKECFVKNNVTVGIAGDSYNKQLFIGLADILLGKQSNYLLKDSVTRNRVLRESQEELSRAGIYYAQFICNVECYGDEELEICGRCIEKFRRAVNDNYTEVERPQHLQRHAVPVIGTGIHVYNRMNRSLSATIHEYEVFCDGTPNIIFNSPPAYMLSKVPLQYQDRHEKASGYYWDFLPLISKYQIRYLDFYFLTRSCTFDNCTIDGGHRTRFVNRWKAQLLLNTICEL